MLCEIWVCSAKQFRLSEKRTFEICASLFLMTGHRNCVITQSLVMTFVEAHTQSLTKLSKG